MNVWEKRGFRFVFIKKCFAFYFLVYLAEIWRQTREIFVMLVISARDIAVYY